MSVCLNLRPPSQAMCACKISLGRESTRGTREVRPARGRGSRPRRRRTLGHSPRVDVKTRKRLKPKRKFRLILYVPPRATTQTEVRTR
eukprot:7237087-Prymnesium_polylepis.1